MKNTEHVNNTNNSTEDNSNSVVAIQKKKLPTFHDDNSESHELMDEK